MNNMERLYAELEKRQLDAMLITCPVNVNYMSGYTGDEAYLLLSPGENFFITDPRYTEQASIECPDYTLVDWRTVYGSLGKTVGMLVEQKKFRAIGFESADMKVETYLEFKQVVHAYLVPVDGVIEDYRSHKTPEEIECLRISCDIASRAFERIIKDIRVGVTEKELAAKLSLYMVMEGADTQPYGNILISGARSSLLHGIPSAKAIEYGDFVLMDYGCQYHGYLSDMTRTVVVGRASAKQREVYSLCQQMTHAEQSALHDGADGYDIYAKGLEIIKGTEYEQYHYPNTGHGVGMFVHEVPFHGWKAAGTIIHAGNVMTVEPGLYIPGWGGVRIENQVLITETGYEQFISATDELIEL